MSAKLKEIVIETELFADYFQFYLQDDDIEKGNLEDAWTKESTQRLLAVVPFVIGIGTVRNMNVSVKIIFTKNSPKIDFEHYDLVNCCCLEIETGRIVIAGCTDNFSEALRVEIPNGLYQVLVGYGNLDSLSEDGLDGNDFYDLLISPTKEFIKDETLYDNRSK